ncbi:hypothetical protein CUMW_025330 [Citrus unshiu]|nr:hypothetical protein CUMW_025330 [Citrus unshiu]
MVSIKKLLTMDQVLKTWLMHSIIKRVTLDVMIHEEKQKQDVGKEIEISENEVVAAKGTGIARRIMIDYA